MTPPPRLEAKSGGKKYIERTIEILSPAFRDDPVYTWMLHNIPISKHESALPKLLRAFFHQGALNRAIFIEVNDFSCCGMFMPPGAHVDNPWTMLQAGLLSALRNVGFGPFKRAVLEYARATEAKIKEIFTREEHRKHWYVFMMGTAVDRRRRGYASALLVHLQDRAQSDGHPIWLEATTPKSRDLYLKHGFTDAGEIVLGAGKVGAGGLPRKAGEGITVWSMFWRPVSVGG